MLKRLALVVAAASPLAAALAGDTPTPAETALFLTDHLRGIAPPATLRYRHEHRGTLEPGFSDGVTVGIAAGDGGSRSAVTRCLSGARQVELPPLVEAQGNPALLCFLERDIRQMQRLTGGQSGHFRQRIRMALAGEVALRPVEAEVDGRRVPAREIRITPYADDPLRARFPRYAGKVYVFRLSDEVPGGLVALDAIVPAGEGEPLVADELRFVGLEGPEKPQR